MIELCEYQYNDRFELPDILEPRVSRCPEAEGRICSNPAWTLYYHDQRVACGGVFILWPGVAEGWLNVSTEAHKHPIPFCRAVFRCRKWLVEERGIHRVQATVDPHFEHGIVLVERFGFKPEAVLRQFTHDRQDQLLFAWTKEG